ARRPPKSIGKAEAERRKGLESGIEADAQRGQKISTRHGDALALRADREFRRAKGGPIGKRDRVRGGGHLRYHGRDGVGVELGGERQRSSERKIEQAFEIEQGELLVVLRLNRERLEV